MAGENPWYCGQNPTIILIKSSRGGIWGLYMNPKVRPEKQMAVKAVHKVRDTWQGHEVAFYIALGWAIYRGEG